MQQDIISCKKNGLQGEVAAGDGLVGWEGAGKVEEECKQARYSLRAKSVCEGGRRAERGWFKIIEEEKVNKGNPAQRAMVSLAY